MNKIIIDDIVKTMDDGKAVMIHRWKTKSSKNSNTVLFIIHGMAEHSLRYDRFASFLAENNITTYALDLRGHGQSAHTENDLGYIAPKNGFNRLVLDIHAIVEYIKSQEIGVPIVILGHSFGSFVAQAYIETYGSEINACMLSGTAGPRLSLAKAGKLTAHIIKKQKGERYRSVFLNSLSFGSYLKHIKNPCSPNAWLSRNCDEVHRYDSDSLCGFICTASFFYDLSDGLYTIHQQKNINKIPNSLPLYLFSGTADPVGDYGKTVQKLYNIYLKKGIKNLTLKLYPDGRHEMLNEINYIEVQNDILAWLNTAVLA